MLLCSVLHVGWCQPLHGQGRTHSFAVPASAFQRQIQSLVQGLTSRTAALQTSMSGIAVSDDAVNLFYYMKAKAAYRWAMWGINPTGTEVGLFADELSV